MLSHTPQEQTLGLLFHLRHTSNTIRGIVDNSMHSDICVLSQLIDRQTMWTLVTLTATFGSVWMLPYFNSAQTVLLGLRQMKAGGHINHIRRDMRAYYCTENHAD